MVLRKLQPNFHCQRVHKGEESGWFATRDLVQNGDAEIHEGFGEVDDGLSSKVDGHSAHGQIRFSIHQSCKIQIPYM